MCWYVVWFDLVCCELCVGLVVYVVLWLCCCVYVEGVGIYVVCGVVCVVCVVCIDGSGRYCCVCCVWFGYCVWIVFDCEFWLYGVDVDFGCECVVGMKCVGIGFWCFIVM